MKQLVVLVIVYAFSGTSCRRSAYDSRGMTRLVNTDHLLGTLYQPATMAASGAAVGTVWIYSEPDASGGYKLVADADEGYTCVDDVSRAGLFLLREADLSTNADKQDKLQKMTRFVLEMQSSTGYFYNFLWPDKTINTTFRTSTNTANWWSWRALWLLSEAYPYFRRSDAPFAATIQAATNRLVNVMLRDFGTKPKEVISVQGVSVPAWLPYGSGADQAAIMLLGLNNVYAQTASAPVLTLLEQLAEGMLLMQQGGRQTYPYGAFLSFENNWHAYGNDQAYALLTVGKALNKPAWIAAARCEVESFYPYLLKQGFLESFSVRQSGGALTVLRQSGYAQIAYGIRPMIWATLALYDQTNDPKLLDQARQLTRWFIGQNVAHALMYDKASGRGFDGISSPAHVSRNAGAESTIEALLAIQAAEKHGFNK
ncbi:hypothetical protein [Fibrella forsythiae]|uniref:Glycosyl hydrolase family 76 n=1 Tax=Fibrella forsythiae TaxID=2817061 RepID=A0ABS3JDB7_9BACT|nr:hypothetical protein [Fibrella forsythiae]MBO0947997.1 hypothetical protein [Fibrella forsythiae]